MTFLLSRVKIVGELMRLWPEIDNSERDNAVNEASAVKARTSAAYPPTTWRTVTRLQSIKCVRLLWLMHYEAIKNGNYSTVLSAARARALAHTREPDHIPCRTSTNALLDALPAVQRS